VFLSVLPSQSANFDSLYLPVLCIALSVVIVTDLFLPKTANLSLVLGNKSVVSSPVETLKPIEAKVVDQFDNMQPSSWRDDKDTTHQHGSFTKALVLPLEGRRENLNGTQSEKGLFSCSLPDIFDKKSKHRALSLFLLVRCLNIASYLTMIFLHRAAILQFFG
jgi:hypothetical protein